jgi:hypothetical protein
MSTQIPDGNALVTFVKDFTGSTNDAEVKHCIFLTELMMRNIELPALRSNPYVTIGIADSNGYVPIPADMNKPIVFFNQGQPGNSGELAGPWIVYDRIGDRDMIAQQLIENLYLQPVNIPQVYRGKFSEVGQNYEFLPGLGAGAEINLYYYRTWPLLFSDDGAGGEVQNNVVLDSFNEGYVYGTLHNYYQKRKNLEEAAGWLAKYNLAYDTIMDQNNKGKWSGGHTKLTSIWQPRTDRRFSTYK